MDIEEAVKYCYKHRDEFIRDYGSIDEGVRSFECLIGILEDGTIKPEELADYGMDYKD